MAVVLSLAWPAAAGDREWPSHRAEAYFSISSTFSSRLEDRRVLSARCVVAITSDVNLDDGRHN